jgi:hypothetical protein
MHNEFHPKLTSIQSREVKNKRTKNENYAKAYFVLTVFMKLLSSSFNATMKAAPADPVVRTFFLLFTSSSYHLSFAWSSKLVSFASFEVLFEFPCFRVVEPSPSICEPSRFAREVLPHHVHADHLA